MKTHTEVPADAAVDPRATAILVNWNTRELLRGCLAALEAAAGHVPLQIVVVDNASTDGSADMVAADFPRVDLVRNPVNAGFARANNLAFGRARGRYLLILNPDARLRVPADLARWLNIMDDMPDVAASGAYVTDGEDRHRLGDAGFRPTWRSIAGLYLFLARVWPRIFPPYFLHGHATAPVDVDWVTGAAMLVRRSVLETVGPFDDRVFMYGEDVEWCCRMRDAGLRVVHLPDVHVTHFEGASTRQQTRAGFSILWFRQLRALYFHYAPREPAWVFDLLLLAGLLLRVVGYRAMAGLRPTAFARARVGQHLACMRHLVGHFGRRSDVWPGPARPPAVADPAGSPAATGPLGE